MKEFVLDLAANPHPKMLAGALEARRNADPCPALPEEVAARRGYWRGYLSAMCDATGETPEAIEAWMDRQ